LSTRISSSDNGLASTLRTHSRKAGPLSADTTMTLSASENGDRCLAEVSTA
jgi:hypothetical protein